MVMTWLDERVITIDYRLYILKCPLGTAVQPSCSIVERGLPLKSECIPHTFHTFLFTHTLSFALVLPVTASLF